MVEHAPVTLRRMLLQKIAHEAVLFQPISNIPRPKRASRDGLVLCSWQLLSYAKATVTRQKEYACEQLNRARFVVSAMPYSSLD